VPAIIWALWTAALFALPHHVRVTAAAGRAYLGHALVGNFAVALPGTL
jgi:hypothetical protein